MADIVLVHGVGQQLQGPHQLKVLWEPALRDGLALSGNSEATPSIAHAFYGDAFREVGGKALGVPAYTFRDLRPGLEQDMLLALAVADGVESNSTKLRTPERLQRCMAAALRSSTLAACSERLLVHHLKQARLYLTDVSVRQAVHERVEVELNRNPTVVIGHSLGSVVAYEVLCSHSRPVPALVTIGSPLGVPGVVFDRLTPAPVDGRGVVPPVQAWTNLVDAADAVALVKALKPLFGDVVADVRVHNGRHPHDVRPYLAARETGAAVRRALRVA